MAHRESAQSAQQGCFLPEWRSPPVPVKAKQRQTAVPAAAMRLAKSLATPRPLWPANCRTKVKATGQLPAKPQLLEQQD
jgi:hypothetical protein